MDTKLYVNKSDITLPDKNDYPDYDTFLASNYDLVNKIPDEGMFDPTNLPMASDMTLMEFDNSTSEVNVNITLKFVMAKCIFTLLFDTADSGYKVRTYNYEERNQLNAWSCLEFFNIFDTYYLFEKNRDGSGGYGEIGLMNIPWKIYPDYTVNEENAGDTDEYYVQPVGDETTFDALPNPYRYMAQYVCYMPERFYYSGGKTTLDLEFKRYDTNGNEVKSYQGNTKTEKTYHWVNEVPADEYMSRNTCYEFVFKVSGTDSGSYTTETRSAATRGGAPQFAWQREQTIYTLQ
jgi:hypothetical protein